MMRERLAAIRLLLLDVDGVLTDGRIILDHRGNELKAFDVKDGQGIKLLQGAGVKVGIITGRSSAVVDHRASELGIDILYQGAANKLDAYLEILRNQNLTDDQVAYVGDDIIDRPLLQRVGFSAAVADAATDIVAVVDHVTKRPGGRGAVREICELILKARNDQLT
jgi:3-deoxy-D-manno-octulosonate 8-phosphate phosphatase (KDO 8-P phosphatase)